MSQGHRFYYKLCLFKKWRVLVLLSIKFASIIVFIFICDKSNVKSYRKSNCNDSSVIKNEFALIASFMQSQERMKVFLELLEAL